MSRILLTGAFGNIGKYTLEELLRHDHEVTCFDLPTKSNLKHARQYKQRARLVWGDISSYEEIRDPIKNNDVIIHLAALIPPVSERNPALARKVNLQGTKNIVQAIQLQRYKPQLLFASSVSVYGRNQDPLTRRTIEDSLEASDYYTSHKIHCENYIKSRLQNWSIFRLGVIPPPLQFKIDPIFYDLPLDTRIHLLPQRDGATAFANSVDNLAVQQKTLLIGGNESCQTTYGDYLGQVFASLGLSPPSPKAFTTQSYYSYWMDTAEGQQLLQYQQHSFDQYCEEVEHQNKFIRPLLRPFSPLVRWWMRRQSPYLKK